MLQEVTIQNLVGETITSYTKTDNKIVFNTLDGETYMMYHDQCCCESVSTESVSIESIDGDLDDILNSPILEAEERTQQGERSEYGDSSTWTFYTIRTVKASITIRWFGTSNGYYSESVDFIKL